MSTPRVTVIVPTYKREQPLVDTLVSLKALDYPKSALEILVVDQAPVHEPATFDYLERAAQEGWITLFKPPVITFASLTKARNFGIQHATNPDIILFVDDDVEVQPDFLQHHVDAYQDPAVMAVAGRVTVPGHTYPAQDPDTIATVTWFGSFVNNFYGTKPGTSDGFVGCNFSVRASILKQTGLFEERFTGNAMREETDLAVRIREVGGTIKFVPEAYEIHHMVVTGGTRSEGRLDWYFAFFHNHFLFYGKHAPAWRMPFFMLHLIRPIIACWLVYGKGSPRAFLVPWRGMKSGLRAAAEARKAGDTTVQSPKLHVF
jgi:GT2 family glycosyltransferase